MDHRRLIATLLGVLIAAILIGAAFVGYRSYTTRYTVKTDDGVAVAQVVQATLSGASDLKVSTLRGTVQSTATDTRGLGMLTSNRLMKAPFEVEYFVDVSALGPADFGWDAARRTLIVRAPPVRVGSVNIDEAHTYIDKTTGMFVTRAAMATLRQQASARADRVATAAALEPRNLARAQENARRSLAALFRGPLGAAGLDATVLVRFDNDPNRDKARWDMSRSLSEVLGNAD